MSTYSYENINYKPHLTSFYKYLIGTNFKNINKNKLNELIEETKMYENFFNKEKTFFSRTNKLVKIINKIKARPSKKDCDMKAESAILFILLVDPTFEATKIYGECNTTKEIKEKMENFFGYFDKNLVKLESLYIKNFLSIEEKKKIEYEIEERIYR